MRYCYLTLITLICVQASFGLSGDLSGDYGPGTISIDGDIRILADDEATLAAGTTFDFTGQFKFDIFGTLSAMGVDGNPIVFTGSDNDEDRWSGLRFHAGSGNSVLTYCVIEKGYARGDDPDGHGGGVYCESDPTFDHCSIVNNDAELSGGGIYCDVSSPPLVSCTISSNVAHGAGAENGGGGLYCNDAHPPVLASFISGNEATRHGGGVFLSRSFSHFENTLFYDNSAGSDGGGVYMMLSAEATFDYCTFSDNAAGGNGGGICCASASMVLNSIIIVSSQGVGIYFGAGGDCRNCPPSYSAFRDNNPGNFGGLAPAGLGVVNAKNKRELDCDQFFNIYLDPLLGGDFHLSDDSPCISSADPEHMVGQDIDGENRPLPDSTLPDIGIDENGACVNPPPGPVTIWPLEGLTIEAVWPPYNNWCRPPDFEIHWAPTPSDSGYMIGTTSDTFWVDYTAPYRPSPGFYYVTAVWPDR